MKYFIVGLNASGKQAVCSDLRALGVNVGSIFRSVDKIPSDTYSLSEVVYGEHDIDSIFENHSYIFFDKNTQSNVSFFEGLSLYEYENNDVFMITPHQFNLVSQFDKDVLFIWLDGSIIQRRDRFIDERRKYNFLRIDHMDKDEILDFSTRISEHDYIYFNNEDPSRVSAIIYSMVTYPELHNIYKERFN